MRLQYTTYFMKVRSLKIVILAFSILPIACEDFVKIDPPKDELTTETVFTSDAMAEVAMRGIYAKMAYLSPLSGGDGSIANLGGLLSDELFYRFTGTYLDVAQNAISADNGSVRSAWTNFYETIYYCNSLMEGLSRSETVTQSTRTTLIAEAKFIRALCYFNLVNLWGDVPVATGTDYRINMLLPRASTSFVYDQVISDLEHASTNLPDEYAAGDGERVRANKWAATALLGRVYLYLEDWTQAEINAAKVIEHSSLFQLVPLSDVFLKNNSESILQLLPTSATQDTYAGVVYLPSASATSVTSYPIRDQLLTTFEAGDGRLSEWVANKTVNGTMYHYPRKYRVKTITSGTDHQEYFVLFRLAEQYLIRAEARAHLGKITGENSAESDINVIRTRAGLPNDNLSSLPQARAAIEQERRLEFFTEGHRWFDLIRTNKADETLKPIKPDWTSDDIRMPIPQQEIHNNPMLSQNAGY